MFIFANSRVFAPGARGSSVTPRRLGSSRRSDRVVTWDSFGVGVLALFSAQHLHCQAGHDSRIDICADSDFRNAWRNVDVGGRG